ncbi:MAG: hypothetical protein RLZZ618_2446 [Pseudomonadota bacterium]
MTHLPSNPLQPATVPVLSQRIYHELFERHPHAVLVADGRGRMLTSNPAAQWIVPAGSVADLAGLPGTPSSPTALAFRQAVLQGTDWTGPLSLRATDGSLKPVTAQVVHTPSRDGEAATVLCIFELTLAPPLVGAELNFRNTVDSAPVMIWTSGPSGDCEWFNRTWLAFTGRSIVELQGQRWLDAVHAEDQERCAAIYQSSFAERQAFSMDYRLRRHDGHYRWVLDNAIPRHNDDGEFIGFIGSSVDIHERKELEERLAGHAQTLRLADRRQNEFLAMLSHELRSPLAPIANAASVLRTLEDANPTLMRLREIIERQVGRLRQLVDDMIDVTRVMQGQISLVKERLSVQDVARAAVEGVQAKADAAGHTLRLEMPKQSLWIQGDAVRLAQSLGNLLGNAIKFMPHPGTVLLSAKSVGGVVRITVRDEGQGISEAFLPHVFDLFSQQNLPHSRAVGGLGLGLPLARRVAQLHGGDVKAFSEGTDRGAEFVMSLPLASASEAQVANLGLQPTASRPSTAYRVLIIEDNPDTAYLLKLQIELWGNQVATANDAAEAAKLIDVFKPQIVLCDIAQPKRDGAQLMQQLRERLPASSTLFAALTGHGRQEDEVRARAAGFDAFLVKPLRPDSLGKLFDLYASRAH